MSDIIPIPKLKYSSPRQALAQFEERLKERVRDGWAFLMHDPVRRKKTGKWTKIGAPVLVLLLAGLSWWIWGPRIRPDYDTGRIDDVFDYTLLSDEFNKL